MSDNGSDYNFPDKIHISKMFSKRDLESEKFNLPGVYLSYVRIACSDSFPI